MSERPVRLSLVFFAGVAAVATGLRVLGDLGDLLPVVAQWLLVSVGMSLVAAGSGSLLPGAVRDASRTSVWPLVAATPVLLVEWSVRTAPLLVSLLLLSALLVARRRRMSQRAAVVVWVYVVALGVAWLSDALVLLHPSLNHPATVLASVYSLLGVPVDVSGDCVVVKTMLAYRPFKVTLNAVGLPVHATIVAVWIAGRWVARSLSGRDLARAAAYLATALPVRFLGVVAIGAALEGATSFDKYQFPFAPFLGWVTTGVLDVVVSTVGVALWLRRRDSPLPELARPSVLQAGACGIAVLAGTFLGGNRLLDCIGPEKPGRIAIDERHSQWESTDLRVGRDTYGHESGYNFRGLADWLEHGYGPIRRVYEQLDAAVLERVDVLIVKTPTRHFLPEEILAIQEFVERGGGLILIGDHTNVFGTGRVLNELAMPFGFHYNFDCVFDHRHVFEELYVVPEEMRDQPVLRELEKIRFEVGCSIDLDQWKARPLIVGRGVKSQEADYTMSNFYPRPVDQSHLYYGQLAQLAAVVHGRGRVLALADSTFLSTFSVFFPGRRELIEGMVAWTNHKDVGPTVRTWVVAAAAALLVLLAFLLRGGGHLAAATAVALVFAGTLLSRGIGERWLYEGNPKLEGANIPEIVFSRASDIVDWPVERFAQRQIDCYSLFYQYVSRVGCFPRLADEPTRALVRRGAPLVLIDPKVDDVVRDGALLEAFVRQGGCVVIMESRPNELASRLAASAGLELGAGGRPTRVFSCFGEITVIQPGAWRTVGGGRRLLLQELPDGTRQTIGTVTSLGQGTLALFTCADLFADRNYGFAYWVVPTPSQRRLYEFGFSLMEALGGPLDPRQ